MTTPEELMALVERLQSRENYGLTLDPNVIICDRRVIDEVIEYLRARLQQGEG